MVYAVSPVFDAGVHAWELDCLSFLQVLHLASQVVLDRTDPMLQLYLETALVLERQSSRPGTIQRRGIQ